MHYWFCFLSFQILVDDVNSRLGKCFMEKKLGDRVWGLCDSGYMKDTYKVTEAMINMHMFT